MSRLEPLRYSRRELNRMIFGASAASIGLSAGCDRVGQWVSGPLPPTGELLTPNREIGHRLREPRTSRVPERPEPITAKTPRHRCVIVGGGVSGLSAGWHLKQNGFDDFVLVELESAVGGTSRSGEAEGFRYPWGAHYLPAPQASNDALVSFLQSCGVAESLVGMDVTYSERYLCREPEERVFANGQWWPGLAPDSILTPEDREQMKAFERLMNEWSARTGSDGKPFFALPTSRCSHDPDAVALDQISFTKWLDSHSLTSPAVRWSAQYACQDDYGLHAEQTSAWAGIFYFVARRINGNGQTQPVLTWPEGNGFLVDRLSESFEKQIRTGHAVMAIDRSDDGDYRIEGLDTLTMDPFSLLAEHVVVAVPEYVRRHLIPAEPSGQDSANEPRSRPVALEESAYQYGSWLVANVHLKDRPIEAGFPMAWDNVSRTSAALGYVNSVHQTGRDHGETVLTWYTALPDDLPATVRTALMTLSWAEASETVIGDLEKVHPDIRPLIERLDVMVWGHAMVQPRVGTIFHPGRKFTGAADGKLHIACTDLSGIALFEEAFDHGRRAAMAVLEWSAT